LVAADGLVDVAGRKLVELLVVAEDDDGDVDRAQHGELMRLLEQAAFALQESAAQGQRWIAAHGKTTYTERLRSSLMALISIFRRPMVTVETQAAMRIRRRQCRIDTRTAVWLVIERLRGTGSWY